MQLSLSKVFFLFALRINRNLSFGLVDSFKFDNAINKCKQSVVFANAYVVAGVEVCTTLSDKNVTCRCKLSVCSFGSQTFAFAIATVLCGTHTFFMSK